MGILAIVGCPKSSGPIKERVVSKRLEGGSMRNADLRGAVLAESEADRQVRAPEYRGQLRCVMGLDQANLKGACGDATTVLPPGMVLPACRAERAASLPPGPRWNVGPARAYLRKRCVDENGERPTDGAQRKLVVSDVEVRCSLQ